MKFQTYLESFCFISYCTQSTLVAFETTRKDYPRRDSFEDCAFPSRKLESGQRSGTPDMVT